MSLTIQKASDFNPANVGFSKIRKNKNGGKTVYLNGDNNKKIYIQLPKMRSPYGLSSYTDEGSGRTSYSLDLSFDNDNEEAAALRKKLEELDDLIVKTVAENSKEWLGKEYNIEVMKQALYKPLVRLPSNDQYPATFKLKILNKQDGTFVPEAYNYKKERVDLDSVEKGQRVVAIVDLSSLWFIDNKFGASVRLSQVLLEQSEKLPSFAFQDIDGVTDGPSGGSSGSEAGEEDDELMIDDDVDV